MEVQRNTGVSRTGLHMMDAPDHVTRMYPPHHRYDGTLVYREKGIPQLFQAEWAPAPASDWQDRSASPAVLERALAANANAAPFENSRPAAEPFRKASFALHSHVEEDQGPFHLTHPLSTTQLPARLCPCPDTHEYTHTNGEAFHHYVCAHANARARATRTMYLHTHSRFPALTHPPSHPHLASRT